MIKHAFLIGFLIFLFEECFSQKVSIEDAQKKFGLTISDTLKRDKFYCIKLTGRSSIELLNNIEIAAARKLGEGLYIIDGNVLLNKFLNFRAFTIFNISNNYWKLSNKAEELSSTISKQNNLYRFTLISDSSKINNRSESSIKSVNKTAADHYHFISILSTYTNIKNQFLDNPYILSIDVNILGPKEELAVKGFDLSANRINTVHSEYPDVTGSGEHVSIKENYYDTTDIDIKGRVDYSPLRSTVITNHANFIATIIAGADNSVYYAKGVAWGARISSSSFDQILPDPSAYYQANNISVQNHSYGSDIDNSYGVNAVAFDKSSNDNLELLHVFSSGNSGSNTSVSGNYKNILGFANITGNFKMAKDVLVAGGVDSFGTVAPLSSRGPAYDGRIKPDITAFQLNGTSESAALVSGTVLLLQQYYKNKNNQPLPSALARAILINTADDINNSGPDYATGFGNLNAYKAMDVIKNSEFFSGNISQGQSQNFSIHIPLNISKVRISLTWNDPATSAFSPKALVNDLDLTVSSKLTNESWMPWVLSSFPNADSLNALAVRRRDSLNNEEQVTIDSPASGDYEIKVRGFSQPAGLQQYYITYSYDTLNYFKWYYPTAGDFLEANTSASVRWENTFSENGVLEFAYPQTNNWQTVNNNINLKDKHLYFKVPDTIGSIIFRMTVSNHTFYSDTILITKLLSPKTGYICGDSILIYWNTLSGINNYQLYNLGDQYMMPFKKVSDTSIVIHKSELKNNFIAVSPILNNGSIGTRSYAFDYTIQGSGCFINSFFADANNNNALLTLDVGTTHDIDSISFDLMTNKGFETIKTFSNDSILHYTYNYDSLKTGISYFRARLVLKSGKIIYSDSVPVFYVKANEYLVFPVPARKNESINFLTSIPNGETIQILNSLGQIIREQQIKNRKEIIETTLWRSGSYFYRIIKKGVQAGSGKIILE